MGKKVVILGGGTGGVIVANQLRKQLPRDDEIVLVDKEKNQLFYPSLLWLMVGWRNEEQIQKPLSLLQRKGINFINAYIEKIDFDKRKVFLQNKDLEFDYLVIATGAITLPESLPGFQEGAYNLYDVDGVKRIREEIRNFDKGKVVILVSSIPFKCPAAPYEAALLLSVYFKRKSRDVEIEIITPEQLPMGVAGPEVGNMVVSLVQSQGISFTPEFQVIKIDPEKREIHFQNQETSPYDLLIGVPPHGISTFLKGSPVLGESGWAKVNPKTLETDIESVYALGDVTSIMLPLGKPLPKAGVFAHYQADVVTHNIAARIRGDSRKAEYDGRGFCFLELGDGRAGFASGYFYTEPKPVVKMKKPSRLWHWGKVFFEKWWFWKWF